MQVNGVTDKRMIKLWSRMDEIQASSIWCSVISRVNLHPEIPAFNLCNFYLMMAYRPQQIPFKAKLWCEPCAFRTKHLD